MFWIILKKILRWLFFKGEEMILDNTDPEGGWVDTHHFHKVDETEEKIAEMTLDEKVTIKAM